MLERIRIPEIPSGIIVLGVEFQAFIYPDTNEPVFSRSGVARGLNIPRTTAIDIINSEEFKTLRGKGSSVSGNLLTTVNSQPISVVTQVDLVILVKLAAEKGYPVAQAMQDASFAVVLQESIDEALGISRKRKEYLDAGATAREKLEYLHSYDRVKQTTFDGGFGVRGLCQVNKQVSGLAVPNADQRRAKSPHWRQKCSSLETMKLTVANTVHENAVNASSKQTISKNLDTAKRRTEIICKLIDEPFE